MDAPRPSPVGPYREPAEDVEAQLDALEIAALRASLARGTWRIRAVVALCVVGPIAAAVAIMSFWLSWGGPVPEHREHTPSCETHMVNPSAGSSFPMTICR